MSNATDTSSIGAAGPITATAGMGDALAFTGAGPVTMALALIGVLSAAAGAALQLAGRLVATRRTIRRHEAAGGSTVEA